MASDLSHAEAVPLAAALVHSVGRRIGVRTLLIKGPTLAEHGIRGRRESNDVDVLVEQSGLRSLALALAHFGWIERAVLFPGQTDAPHALTLVHPDWPCDLDLHHFFPGMLADPSESFDALWRTRATMTLAHVECAMPNAVGSALIYQLSLLRGRASAEIPDLHEWARALTSSERAELSTLIRSTGSDLSLTGCPEPWASGGLFSDEHVRRATHRRRALTGDHGYHFWHIAYTESTMRERLGALFAMPRGRNRPNWRRAARGASRFLRTPDQPAP